MRTEEWEAALRWESRHIADTTVLMPVGAVRARGDRRRHRAAAAIALGVAVAAGGASTAVAVGLRHAGASGATGPASGHNARHHHGTRHHPAPVQLAHGQLRLRLTVPSVYAYGEANPVSLAIRNRARARTVTVSLNLGDFRPRYSGGPLLSAQVYHRGARGSWVSAPARHTSGGWIATFTRPVGRGLTRAPLLLIPPSPAGPDPVRGLLQHLTVSLSAGGHLLAVRTAPVRPVLALTGFETSGGDRAGVTDVAFTFRNPASTKVPVQLYLSAAACSGTTCQRHLPRGYTVEWLDGSVWRVTTIGPPTVNFGRFLVARWFPGQSGFRLRLRIVAGPHARHGTAQLRMWIDTGTQAFDPPRDDRHLTPAITQVEPPAGIVPIG